MRTKTEAIRVLNAPVSNINSLLKGQGSDESRPIFFGLYTHPGAALPGWHGVATALLKHRLATQQKKKKKSYIWDLHMWNSNDQLQ